MERLISNIRATNISPVPSLFAVFMGQEFLTDRSNTSLNFELAKISTHKE